MQAFLRWGVSWIRLPVLSQVIFSFSSENHPLYKGGDTAESWAREWGNGTCAKLLADAVEKAVHRLAVTFLEWFILIDL